MFAKLTYIYDQDLIKKLAMNLPESNTSFVEFIFFIFQLVLQSANELIDSFEKEVRTIHALSFSLSYQERHIHNKELIIHLELEIALQLERFLIAS